MRTTLTLDREVERLLKKAMRLRNQSFKQALNQAVLQGLADLADDQQEPPFEFSVFPDSPPAFRCGTERNARRSHEAEGEA